jgi:hypothetical protein
MSFLFFSPFSHVFLPALHFPFSLPLFTVLLCQITNRLYQKIGFKLELEFTKATLTMA